MSKAPSRRALATTLFAAPVLAATSAVAQGTGAGGADAAVDVGPFVQLGGIAPASNVVRTSGYWSPGDGGGALYALSMVQAAAPFRAQTADGRWFELIEMEPWAEQLGLRAGAGVSADIANFNAAALNAAAAWLRTSGGGVIRFRARLYRFGATVSIPTSVALEGSGLQHAVQSGTTLQRTGDFVLLSYVGVSITKDPTNQTSIDAVRLRALTIDGGSASYLTDLVSWSAVREALCEFVRFATCGGRVLFMQEVFDSLFMFCRFDAGGSADGKLPCVEMLSGAAGWDYNNNVRFFGCTWESGYGVALACTGRNTNKISLISCKIEWNRTEIAPLQITGSNVVDLDVQITTQGRPNGAVLNEMVRIANSVGVRGRLRLEHRAFAGNSAPLHHLVTLDTVNHTDLDIFWFGTPGDIVGPTFVVANGGTNHSIRVSANSNPDLRESGVYGWTTNQIRLEAQTAPALRFRNRGATDTCEFEMRVVADAGASSFRLVTQRPVGEFEVLRVAPDGATVVNGATYFNQALQTSKALITDPRGPTAPSTAKGAIWCDGPNGAFRFQHDTTAVMGAARAFKWAVAAPTAGSWQRGDIVFNIAPTAGGVMGWMCVTAGTPGVWKAMGNLAT